MSQAHRRKLSLVLVLLTVGFIGSCGGGSDSRSQNSNTAGNATLFYSNGGMYSIYINDPSGRIQAALGTPFAYPGLYGMAATSWGVFMTYGATGAPGRLDVPSKNANTRVCPAMGVDVTPIALTASPNLKFFFVGNEGSNDVSAFTMDSSSGCLTAQGNFITDAGPRAVAVDRSNAYLFVATAGGGVDTFAIDPTTAALTRLPAAGFDTGTGGLVYLATSPSANLLFVTDESTNVVHVLQIDLSTGALTPVVGSPFATGGIGPTGITVNSSGSLLFIANTGSDNISAFSVHSNGTLTAVPGSPFGGGLSAPVNAKMDPTERWLYIANSGRTDTNTVSVYSIGSSGTLNVLQRIQTGVPAGPNTMTLAPYQNLPPICTPSC